MKNTLKTCQTLPLTFEPGRAIAGQNPLAALYGRFKSWHLRRRNRLILSALSDDQLKDIGLSRSEVELYDKKK
ncbi:DUF1127 domain-containing protein [Acerihabitans arboris]|uniref:DUF1127 domain-containing protein n=1 Tax=Acerihabitans arboris TaxID=2691583 RepID=A0A845SPN0_9GAMM|nr:DUF1127 domain-containing protein [Acerihabitans arboris]NDL64488.1 DUF1127 domain-containing protein [Acerihabitans arboris]